MIKRFLIVGIILALLAGGLIGFDIFKKKMMAGFFASMVPPPPPVSTAVAESIPVPNILEAVGSLEAVRQVTISPEVGGLVDEIMFEAGAEVKAGDMLVRMNDDAEKGDLEVFRAQEKLSSINLSRSSKLADVAAPRTRIDEYRASLDEARGNIARTEARIAQKLLKAPFDGVLGIRQVNLGQFLNPGAAVVTLTDLTELYVNFSLPEQARGQVAVGQKVALSVDAWPGKTFEATINVIEPQIGEDTRTVKVQALLANTDKALYPGMFAKVKVYLPEGGKQVVVPETAVDFTIYGDSVFVVTPEKNEKGEAVFKADRVYVKTGKRFDNRVEIVSGLKPGHQVVTSGQLKLNPGGYVVPGAPDKIAADYKARQQAPTNE